MAVMRTIDPREAVIELMVAPGWETDFEILVAALGREVPIEPLPAPPVSSA